MFAAQNPQTMAALLAATERAMTLIHDEPGRAAAVYLASEKSNLGKDEVERILTDGATQYRTTPHGVMVFARFMQQIGMIKTAPAAWQDVFFPEIHGASGS